MNLRPNLSALSIVYPMVIISLISNFFSDGKVNFIKLVNPFHNVSKFLYKLFNSLIQVRLHLQNDDSEVPLCSKRSLRFASSSGLICCHSLTIRCRHYSHFFVVLFILIEKSKVQILKSRLTRK